MRTSLLVKFNFQSWHLFLSRIFPLMKMLWTTYADELEDSPGDFTPEDERSGREEEETDDDSISLAEAILRESNRKTWHHWHWRQRENQEKGKLE